MVFQPLPIGCHPRLIPLPHIVRADRAVGRPAREWQLCRPGSGRDQGGALGTICYMRCSSTRSHRTSLPQRPNGRRGVCKATLLPNEGVAIDLVRCVVEVGRAYPESVLFRLRLVQIS
eukprot:scaffold11371_cov112-Isochrysis_galbana.AAC.1